MPKRKVKNRSERWICDILKDEFFYEKIEEIKRQHGKILLRGRHPNRKGIARKHGFKLNFCRDLPWRYAKIVAVYRR